MSTRAHPDPASLPFWSRWTSADVGLLALWGALAVIFLAYAFARGSIGAFVLAAFVVRQIVQVWTVASSRDPFDPPGTTGAVRGL